MNFFFIRFGWSINPYNNNSIAFIFNTLNRKLGIRVLNLESFKCSDKRSLIDAILENEVYSA
jgi:hypothetical protein